MGIRIGIGSLKIGQGSTGVDWSSYWATQSRLPFFALPARGIDIVVGQEVTIYGDSLINQPIGADLTVTYTCDIGSASGNNYTITPVAGDIGSHTFRAVFSSNGITREDKTVNINVKAAITTDSMKVLLIGDSTTSNGISYITDKISEVLAPTVTFLGTQGTTVKHEGYPGWYLFSFATRAESPFVKAEVVDIPAYFTDNSIATPDFVVLRLGVNDAISSSDEYLKSGEIAYIHTTLQQIIDGFLAFDPNLKFIIQLPTICENTGAGWNANYDESVFIQNEYIRIIHQLWNEIIDTYDNGAYDSRVLVGCEAIFLDRNDGYPKTDGVHNNGVHPDQSGYEQLGVATALTLNAVHDHRFKMTVDTTQAGSAADTFVLPTAGGAYVYDYYVDWGDGGAEEHVEVNTSQTHIYAEGGTYQIKIRGTFPYIKFNNGGDKAKLISIDNWGDIAWLSMEAAFRGCANMQGAWLDTPNLSAVTNVSYMFNACSIFNWPLHFRTTDSVQNFSYFLGSCSLFNSEIDVDTTAATNMAGMFYSCTAFNQPVTTITTALVQNMSYMFYQSQNFNQSLAHFDTGAVTDMQRMLQSCVAFKQSLAAFDIGLVADMTNMLYLSNINNTGTTTNYDATLVSWAAQTVVASVAFHGGASKYSDTGETARNILTGEPNTWAITDGGHI